MRGTEETGDGLVPETIHVEFVTLRPSGAGGMSVPPSRGPRRAAELSPWRAALAGALLVAGVCAAALVSFDKGGKIAQRDAARLLGWFAADTQANVLVEADGHGLDAHEANALESSVDASADGLGAGRTLAKLAHKEVQSRAIRSLLLHVGASNALEKALRASDDEFALMISDGSADSTCGGSLLVRAAQELNDAVAKQRAKGRVSLMHVAAAHARADSAEEALVQMDSRAEKTARALEQDLEAGALIARHVQKGRREVGSDEATLSEAFQREQAEQSQAAELRVEAKAADAASEEELDSLAVSNSLSQEIRDDNTALAAQRQEEALVKQSLSAAAAVSTARKELHDAEQKHTGWSKEGKLISTADAAAQRAAKAERQQASNLRAEESRAQEQLTDTLEGAAAVGAGVARNLAELETLAGRVHSLVSHCKSRADVFKPPPAAPEAAVKSAVATAADPSATPVAKSASVLDALAAKRHVGAPKMNVDEQAMHEVSADARRLKAKLERMESAEASHQHSVVVDWMLGSSKRKR